MIKCNKWGSTFCIGQSIKAVVFVYRKVIVWARRTDPTFHINSYSTLSCPIVGLYACKPLKMFSGKFNRVYLICSGRFVCCPRTDFCLINVSSRLLTTYLSCSLVTLLKVIVWLGVSIFSSGRITKQIANVAIRDHPNYTDAFSVSIIPEYIHW